MSATADIVLSILPCFLGLLHRTLADTLLALLGTGLPAPLLLGQCHVINICFIMYRARVAQSAGPAFFPGCRWAGTYHVAIFSSGDCITGMGLGHCS